MEQISSHGPDTLQSNAAGWVHARSKVRVEEPTSIGLTPLPFSILAGVSRTHQGLVLVGAAGIPSDPIGGADRAVGSSGLPQSRLTNMQTDAQPGDDLGLARLLPTSDDGRTHCA